VQKLLPMKEMAVMGAGTEAFRDVAVASISCRGHWRGCWVTWTGLETGEVKETEERSGGRRGDSQTGTPAKLMLSSRARTRRGSAAS
jgi:hypothetical protein